MLALLSEMDRYHFEQQGVGFYYTEDKECWKKFGLDEKKNYLLMLNGHNSIESHIEIEEND